MKKFPADKEQFIREYALSIISGDAAVFIGAGLSRDAGYLGWTDLLKDKAEEIGLDVEKEKDDLISLAQYYLNNKKQRTQISDAIRNFFAPNPNKNPTETHLLLSTLPIRSYWTTNYDRMIERTFELRGISCRAHFNDENLSISTNNAQIVVHKMHGDVENPNTAVIAKEDYETYNDTHEMMLARFKGEMCSKTFLFLGYSFSDPNIHHILARIRKVFDKHAKQHYCIIKKVPKKENGKKTKDYEYKLTKQNHQILDFKNYGVNVLLVDEYSEITQLLSEVKKRVFMKNIFICGALEDETANKKIITQLGTTLATWLIERGFKIFSGFGKNFGGHIVKGAFDGCTLGEGKDFNKNVSLFPFPYNVEMSSEDRKKLFTRLRENMLANTHVTIVICGEKKDAAGNLVPSPGVIEEVNISRKQGNLIIPVGVSGGAANVIWEEMKNYSDIGYKKADFNKLNEPCINYSKVFRTLQNIIINYCL